MSLIACTSNCVYQQDGYCSLERAASCGLPSDADPCVNFVPRYQNGSGDTTVLPPPVSM